MRNRDFAMRTISQLYFLPYLLVLLFVPLQLFASTRGISVISKEGKNLYLYKDYYALVVGVSDYEYWPDLQGVEDDVRKTTKALEDSGFNVSMLLNPTSRELREKLNSLAYEVGSEEDRAILFYFSGHGETETLATGEKLGYLIPRDCPILNQDLIGFSEKAISMNLIETYALRIKSKHVLMLFDSCFSGSMFASLKSVPSDISEKSSRPVRQFITAGNEDEQVPDDSIFNTVLIQGIKGDADYNEDGYVTGSELGMYLDTRVVNYSQGSQHPQYGRIRHPKLDKGDFIFVLDKENNVSSISIKEEKKGESVVAEERQQKKIDDAMLEEERELSEERDMVAEELQRLEKERRLIEEEWRHLEEEAGNNLSAEHEVSRMETEIRERESRLDEEGRELEEERRELDDERRHLEKEWGQLEKEQTSPPPPPQHRDEPPGVARPYLRSRYKRDLSLDQVQSVPFLSIREKNWNSLKCYSTVKHFYEVNLINNDSVVIDRCTGLMWHQSGTPGKATWNEAKKLMQRLNNRGYGGYHDWRLPTLEEAMSLLEPDKKNGGLFISPVFDRYQEWIWTGDKKKGANAAWDVNFRYGLVTWSPLNDRGFVRPVRSLKKPSQSSYGSDLSRQHRRDDNRPPGRPKRKIDKMRKIDRWMHDHRR